MKNSCLILKIDIFKSAINKVIYYEGVIFPI